MNRKNSLSNISPERPSLTFMDTQRPSPSRANSIPVLSQRQLFQQQHTQRLNSMSSNFRDNTGGLGNVTAIRGMNGPINASPGAQQQQQRVAYGGLGSTVGTAISSEISSGAYSGGVGFSQQVVSNPSPTLSQYTPNIPMIDPLSAQYKQLMTYDKNIAFTETQNLAKKQDEDTLMQHARFHVNRAESENWTGWAPIPSRYNGFVIPAVPDFSNSLVRKE
ncbi:hypothetical protein G9A89_002865 [Geosiphon pyriformis]|nr:hypothetical protein G9A89_002865 [Geosiphon pyriformis]